MDRGGWCGLGVSASARGTFVGHRAPRRASNGTRSGCLRPTITKWRPTQARRPTLRVYTVGERRTLPAANERAPAGQDGSELTQLISLSRGRGAGGGSRRSRVRERVRIETTPDLRPSRSAAAPARQLESSVITRVMGPPVEIDETVPCVDCSRGQRSTVEWPRRVGFC